MEDYTLMILCRNHVDGKCDFYKREWNASTACIFAKINIGSNNYLCSNLDVKHNCLRSRVYAKSKTNRN